MASSSSNNLLQILQRLDSIKGEVRGLKVKTRKMKRIMKTISKNSGPSRTFMTARKTTGGAPPRSFLYPNASSSSSSESEDPESVNGLSESKSWDKATEAHKGSTQTKEFVLKNLDDADIVHVRDIKNRTEREENLKIEDCFSSIRDANPIGIRPNPYCLDAVTELQLQIEILNYSDENLSNPQCSFLNGMIKNPAPAVVVGGTKEWIDVQPIMRLPSRPGDSLALATTVGVGAPTILPYKGLISYDINDTNYRLIIAMEMDRIKRLYGIALAPKSIPTDMTTYNFLSQYTFKFRRDIDTVWGPISPACNKIMYVYNQSFVAVATATDFLTSKSYGRIKVELGSLQDLPIVPFAYEPSPAIDLFSISMDHFIGGTVTAKMFVDVECLDDEASCIVEIRNALKVHLDVPLRTEKLENPESRLAKVVKSFSKDFCYFPNLQYTTVGVFSYRIKSTDMRLYIAFQVTENSNYFGLYFDPLETKPYSSNKIYLPTTADWKDKSNTIYSKADLGVINLQYRNVLVQAKMSEGKKAMLELVITSI